MRRVLALVVAALCVAQAWPARADGNDKERKKQEKKLLKGDLDDRREAASYLWNLSDEGSVPALIEGLKDKDALVRSNVAGALWNLKEKARPAEAALKVALSDSSMRVRLNAAGALEALGTPPEKMADSIAPALTDREHEVRADAAHFLRRAGTPAVEVLPALLRCVREGPKSSAKDQSRYSDSQHQCREDLRKIGLLSKAAIPILDEALTDDDREVRVAAAGVLGRAGGTARAEIPALINALKDRERDVRWEAANSLGEFGNSAKSAVPGLTELIRNDPDTGVRMQALRSLEDIDKDVKVSLPGLLAALKDSDKEIRETSARRFQYLDVVPREAVEPLKAAMARDPEVKESIERALQKAGGKK